MKPVTVSTSISVDPDRAYAAIVDIERLPRTSPDTVAISFLGEQRSGAGTRFRETRRMGGNKTQDFELELAACDPSARTAQFVCEMEGTIWDTQMKVVADSGGSLVEFTMEAKTDSRIKSVIFSLMRGVFRRAMNKQVVALKRYCEE